ncbi:hypothetical protein M8J77_024881 [Diaphorina citri]|nr:hypothetical protein M8J77_024881 [Diaphorina citri]
MKEKIITRQEVVPEILKLKYYTDQEVKQLSVVKVFSPITFNSLGHTIPGGLYDLAMGPISERGDPCTTCGNNYTKCKGHIGHIELPVPVINTLFFRDVQLLLKLSCFLCHKINIPATSQLLFINQIKLLDAGYVTQAKDLEETLFNEENLRLHPAQLVQLVDSHVQSILAHGTKICDINDYKGGEELRSAFVAQVLSRHVKRKCIFCATPINAISYQQRKIIKSFKIDKDNLDQSLDKSLNKSSNQIIRKREQGYVMASEVEADFKKLWTNEHLFLKCLIPVLDTTKELIATDIMFIRSLVVPPNNLRPLSMEQMPPVEHSRNKLYQSILYSCGSLKSVIMAMKNKEQSDLLSEALKGIRGDTLNHKLQNSWHELQYNVDLLMDAKLNINKTTGAHQIDGLKQMLDGKTGMIRQNMMGKRVNFAGRSVITPDPYLNIDSIGVPLEFAKTLTYPVPVTPWNVTLLRKMVINGPNVYPGANTIQNEDGSVVRISSSQAVQRESLAKRLITPEGNVEGNKIIYRHMLNGDLLLVNRQPTLHRPSIMAHKAKILSEEKTLRLHYANCKAYNADFDGDEMNIHLVQDEIGRAEASFLMNVSSQYLVPKDGSPLSGLIQDHVISGAKLSLRDTFLTRAEYMNLVYQALCILNTEIRTLPPTIWKPMPLWTGKQVLSTVIINLTPKDKVPITLNSTSKIPLKAWNYNASPLTAHMDQKEMSEFMVIIRHGELLSGILDKKQFGSTQYGLVHAVWDTHGAEHAISLLSSLAKLFTVYLQRVGFTLGVRDILVRQERDRKRTKIINKARRLGTEAACNALGLPLDTDPEIISSQLQEAYASIPQFRAQIDRQYKSLLDKVTNNINQVCLPEGLIEPFPANNLQFMVESGAKGSTVNTMQISCLLGQIELEGKRPAMMVSGRTLPSFLPYEVSPRAGGFVDGRFMTGIQPQEFFFHCMAGREGLIDTAVKTSRSGYLQRCLVKHLEGLTVHYDMTVRDSDLSLIQVLYGEDGLDVTKRQYLTDKQFSFLEDNIKSIVDKKDIRDMKQSPSYATLTAWKQELDQWRLKHGDQDNRRQSPFTLFCDKMKKSLPEYSAEEKVVSTTGRTKSTMVLLEQWYQLDDKARKKYRKKFKACPQPLISTFQPDAHFGSISENLADSVVKYTKGRTDASHVDKFYDMIFYKNLLSLANPGENVGVLAAQSIGEPSTQMTLNTFHFAGRGDMNVTLGIPRLREILMMATKAIKTPSMEIPFLPDLPKLEKKANRLAKSMTRITMADVLEKVKIKEWLEISPEPHMNYQMKFCFIPAHMYRDKTSVKPSKIIDHFERKFLKELEVAIAKRAAQGLKNMNIEQSRDQMEDDVEDDEGEGAEGAGAALGRVDVSSDEERDEEDAVQSHKKVNQEEDNDFEEPEDEERMSEREEDDNTSNIGEKSTAADLDASDNEADADKNDNETSDTDGELDERAQDVVNQHNIVHKYSYDKKNHMWCKVHLWLTLKCHRVDMSHIIRTCAGRSVIHHVPGVKRAIVMETNGVKRAIVMETNGMSHIIRTCAGRSVIHHVPGVKRAIVMETNGVKRAIVMETNGKHLLKTDGINVNYISQYRHLLDLNKLYVNDIHYMASTYGIEAANRVIIREVKNVFAVYGIEVDPRHLSLVADYMTHSGTYVAMNRNGIRLNPSFIQKMTFEMPLEKIRQASMQGREDSLRAPSARVMLGQECRQGTGLFQLRNREKKKKKVEAKESIKRQAPRPPTSKVTPLTLSPTTNFSQRSTTRHCCCPNSDITTLLTELSNPNDELWMLMDQSYESEMNSLNSEQSDQTNDGIVQSNDRMDQMNNRIEQTNDRRDQTNGRIDQTSNRIDQTNYRIDQTDNRIDQTNDRIDQTNDTSDQTVDRRGNAGETDVNDEIKDDTSSEITLIPQDISARRENHNELIINSAKDRQGKEVSPKCNTSPSIINMKLKDNQKHDSDKNGQEREQDIRSRKIIRDLTPKFPRRPIVSKPDINMEDVVNKVNETYKKSNYLSIKPLKSRRFEETSSGSNDVNGNAKVGRTDGSLGLREVVDDITPTEENLRREITFSDENPNSKIDVSARKLMDSSKDSHLTTMILDVPNEERSSNTLEDKIEKTDSNEEKSSNTVDDNINKFLVEIVETPDSNLTNTDELDPSRDETIPQETNGLENESTSIIPPPNEFANKTNLTRIIESINQHYLRSENKSMGIILDDFEAQAVNGLHENVMNTFTNPLAQVTYYNHAQEFNQYLSTMLSEESTEETGIIANTGANGAPQSGIDKTRDSREVFRRNRETSSDVEFSSDSCASKDNALTQDEFDPYVDSSEVSSVNEFTLNDLNPNAFSFETHWKFVKPEHSDSIEVNLSDDSEMNSGYDSSSEESAEKSDEPESPIVKEKQCNDEGVSNFLFRLNADIETFLNTDRKDGPSEVKSTTARPVTPVCEPNSHHDVKKIEFKKQNKILPLVLQNSLTGSSYPANHPDFIDGLENETFYSLNKNYLFDLH